MDTTLKIGLAFAILLILGVLFFRGSGGDLSSADARKLISDGARLIDVRSPAEFADGHLPNAVNIPLQILPQHLSTLEPKDKPIVLYCRSGNRSGQAASILKDAGFSAVHNLGAMSKW